MNGLYHKHTPYLASIKERISLCKPGSKKNTQHVVLDLKNSGITYEVGDSVGIFPQHDPSLVRKTIEAMKTAGDESIYAKQSNEFIPLTSFLSSKANITTVSLKLLKEVYQRQTNVAKKQELAALLEESQHQILKEYLNRHEVWDFLIAHQEVNFTSQELADLLMPLLPRFYSISSSQKYVGNEVHLTIAPLEYESNGHKRHGICSHYLCQLVELHQAAVPIFIQPSHGFQLPQDLEASLIMIGPGTGVAPFRAFMQERLLHHQAKGKHWLFFGEWNRDYDFIYEEDWNHLKGRGHLRMDLAFSRDQPHKVYVQHKLQERGAELFEWLEQGAYLYVCGDAHAMAKDVDATLHGIIQNHGARDAIQAKEYVKQLRQKKRYLRDVY